METVPDLTSTRWAQPRARVTHALVYHDVVDPEERDEVGFPGRLAARQKLTPEQFDAHLDALERLDLPIGLISEEGRGPECALTFDDGGSSALAVAEALEYRGWRGHFFITTGHVDAPGFLSAGEVAELHERGHAVGSHSHSHPAAMGQLERRMIAAEWRLSREALAELLGKPPMSASVPGGSVSRPVIEEAAAAGYRLLMTAQPTAEVIRHDDLAVVGRYTISAGTSAQLAAGCAGGDRRARMLVGVKWQTQGLSGRVAFGAHQAARMVRAREL